MPKIKITSKQYEALLLNEQKNRLSNDKGYLNEGLKEIILGVALLSGLKLSGLNKTLADKAINNVDVINQIKNTLENEHKLKELSKSFGEKGLVNPDYFFAKNADKITKEFNKISKDKKIGEEAKINLISLDSGVRKKYDDELEQSNSDIITI